MQNPEYRLISRSGQDRSVKRKNYALTTDKGSENRRRYSLLSRNNKKKRELTQRNIFDSNPLLKRAKDKFYEKLDGGERIMVPLNYAQTTSSDWYSGK